MTSDSIADMLTRVRNAVKAQFNSVDIPASRVKMELAKVLRDEGFIRNYKLIKDNDENLLSEGRFYQKCPIGIYIEYYSNHKIKLKGNWALKEGVQFATIKDANCSVKDGQWVYYYEGGQVQKEEFYTKGIKHGPWLYYSAEGHTTGLIEYKNGEIVKQVGKAN